MIKLFEQYNEYSQIKEWLDNMGIENYTINDDLTVDVNGDVNLNSKKMLEIPIKFGIVNGGFQCEYNELTSLVGLPNRINGYLKCTNNDITSLIGCPEYVGGNLRCTSNELESLEGLPKFIGGDLDIRSNYIKSLKGLHINIMGSIYIGGNPLPEEFTSRNIKSIVRYQDEYSIWNSDGTLNSIRFKYLMNDYNTGILE